MGFFIGRGDKMSKYTEYRKKLVRRINKLNKQGIHLDIPSEKILTEKQLKKTGVKGSKLTAQTRQLKKMLKDFKNLQAYSESTGEIGYVYELLKSAKESIPYTDNSKQDFTQFTDIVIRTYKEQIRRFPSKVAGIVLSALDEAINKSGRDNVALALQSKSESLSDYLNRSQIFGDSISAVIAYCQAMFGDLPGIDDHFTDVIDALEEEESMEY